MTPRKSTNHASASVTTKPPKPSRRQWAAADHNRRREWIVQAALDLIDRKGVDALTARAIARRLGLGTMTLYSYFAGLDDLKLAVIRQAFCLLNQTCTNASTLGTTAGWRGSAKAYLQFAIDHPNLYTLMFNRPLPQTETARGDLEAIFQNLVEIVAEQLAQTTPKPRNLQRLAQTRAETYWIALHGLASLAIAQRLGTETDRLLDDLLTRVAPTPTNAP